MTDNNNQDEFDSTESENENDNSSDSSTENNETDDTQSNEGDDTNTHDEDTEDDKPFNEHPRWKEREDAWNKRFNEQETRHQDELKKIYEKIEGKKSGDKPSDDQPAEVPKWFGGDQAAWDEYLADLDRRFEARESKRQEQSENAKKAEEDAVKEATEFMQSEISAIESDKTLNPKGEKVDPKKLLKIVLDEQLIDTKGRWNYRAAWKIMKGQPAAPAAPNNDRKNLAGATNSESKAETKPTAFKTSADFKKNKPW